MLGIGVYFFKKNENIDDYYVAGRNINFWHTGLSVVATDVGGGFSIGLGGLGFIMGLSGSWMLFTGLLGAWLSAVFLIPKIRRMPQLEKLYTFPQIFDIFYDKKVALLAGIITAIGYTGFTGSQLLAGAKLAGATFPDISINQALIIMGVIAVIYTTIGGLKAVIYTDTIQWIILISGLIFIGIPLSYYAIGGYEVIFNTLGDEFFTLSNIEWQQLVNWSVTIIPIWFIGMTLYQRIYSCKSEKEAVKAWYLAGLFEWPIMAFMGIILGLFSRVAFENDMFSEFGFSAGSNIDSEMGLPLLLVSVLPIGLMGLMMSAYFSAIMSTADSCLMAASGNVQTDILKKFRKKKKEDSLISSQIITLFLGTSAVILATLMDEVLEMMLLSYAFMVSGLFIPIIGTLFWEKASSNGSFWSMLGGGVFTSILILYGVKLPYKLDPIVFGIMFSFLIFYSISIFENKRRN